MEAVLVRKGHSNLLPDLPEFGSLNPSMATTGVFGPSADEPLKPPPRLTGTPTRSSRSASDTVSLHYCSPNACTIDGIWVSLLLEISSSGRHVVRAEDPGVSTLSNVVHQARWCFHSKTTPMLGCINIVLFATSRHRVRRSSPWYALPFWVLDFHTHSRRSGFVKQRCPLARTSTPSRMCVSLTSSIRVRPLLTDRL